MRPHGAVNRRQTEPRALTEWLRREERLEHALAHLIAHARARVADTQHHRGARREARTERSARGLVERDRTVRDRQGAAVGHRVLRVERKVQDRMLHRGCIGAYVARSIARHHDQVDVLVQCAREQPRHVGDEPADLEALGAPAILAPEREQLLRERRRTQDRVVDQVDVVAEPARVVALEAVASELATGEDRAEHVVQVVRDPTRELTERFEPSRRRQLRARGDEIAHVDDLDEHVPDAALRSVER